MPTAVDITINWRWYDLPPTHLTGFRRALVNAWFEQIGRECADCEREMQYGKLWRRYSTYATIDHILSRGMGGTDHLENLRVICSKCNRIKSKWESAKATPISERIPIAFRAPPRTGG